MAMQSGSGYTNFPKATFTYRWVINDGKFVQRHYQQQQQPSNPRGMRGYPVSVESKSSVLKSPELAVFVPKDFNGSQQKTVWSLAIKSGKLFLCHKPLPPTPIQLPVASSNSSVTSTNVQGQPPGQPSSIGQPLGQPSSIGQPLGQPSLGRPAQTPQVTFHNFCIVDCVAFIIDQETGKSKHKIEVPNVVEGSVNDSLMVSFGDENLLAHVVPSKPIVIQATATILFHTNPIGTMNRTGKVPPNDTLKMLFKNKNFADLIIKCGDEEFKVHKAILACQSPVFNRMLEADMKEKHSGIIEISDISPAVMSNLLAFVYTDTSPNMNTLAKELMVAANKYELPRLLAVSENTLMMRLTLENVVETLVHAEIHQSSKLKQACLKLIKGNSTSIFKSDSWKAFREMDEFKTLIFEVFEFSVL